MCGLGNQLFQYAAACGVAHAAGAKVALDASEFAAGSQERPYMLDRYDLGIPILTGCSFDPDFRSAHVPVQDELASIGIEGSFVVPVYRQDNYEFEPIPESLRGDAYLYGFWQSWKYFADVADGLRRRLIIAPRGGSQSAKMMQAVSKPEAVAVHVRRGDYVTPYNQNIFGVCEPAYYAAAMQLMRERLRSPAFFIFSDDPDWCKTRFTDKDTTIVSTPGCDARDDLALMARCRHHIIANSSLSWWGAWLGEKETSIIVSPIPWYTQSPRVRDLIPDHWIRLDRATGHDWSIERPRLPERTVSVVVLARHGAASLLRALNSVRAQTYGNLDIVIASCEPAAETTISVAKEWAARDGHTQLAQASRPGTGAALNAGLSCANGEWVAFLDDCDVWMPTKIEIQLEAAHLAAAEVVSCRTVPVEGPRGLPTIFPPPGPPSCSVPRLLKSGHFISGISHVLAQRRIVEAVGPFDDHWSPEEDSTIWRRLLWDHHLVMLWERLVKSPIPYLAQSNRLVAAS